MSTPTRNSKMLAPSRDTHTNWNAVDPIIPEGVMGITKNRLYSGSIEYFIGDGTNRYSVLGKFGVFGDVHFVSDLPSVELGKDGDTAFGNDGKVYTKTLGSWILKMSYVISTTNKQVIASAPCYYARDYVMYASDKLKLTMPKKLWLNITDDGFVVEKVSADIFNLAEDAVWDSKAVMWAAETPYVVGDVVYPTTRNNYLYKCTTPGTSSSLAPVWPVIVGNTYNDGNAVWTCQLDYAAAVNRAGKDFYVYACAEDNGSLSLILSGNSTIPNKYTADNSRKIGGFHCLCVGVGTIAGHTLTDYIAGDILPASVWDLQHRPTAETEGMVYIAGLDVWVDIYLASYTGTYAADNLKLKSIYNGVIADGASGEIFHWYKFSQVYATQKKHLLSQPEFVGASIGSNQSTNIFGSVDPNTTGGHKDTASRRMISNFGLEDCCGVLSQWGSEAGGTYGAAAYANAYDANDKYVGGQSYYAPSRVLLGGYWAAAVLCGSRCSDWDYAPSSVSACIGGRGASEPLTRKTI